MPYSILEEYILGRANSGDIVLIEYSPRYPIEEVSWGLVIPELIKTHNLVVADFFGVGNLLFKNYVRKLTGRRYRELLEVIKRIKVVKIGPGSISYGDVIDEIVPTYDPQGFLKDYYSILNKVGRLPYKPDYFVSFGLAHYIHFNRELAIRSILTSLTTIPMEEWVDVHFINFEILDRETLAMLEEVASIIIRASEEGIETKKGGEAVDSRGG